MAFLRGAAFVAAGASVGLGIIVACGGSDGEVVAPTNPDATTTPFAPPEGGMPLEAGPTYTLDNVCDRTANELCDMRKACCTAASAFDLSGCVAYQKTICAKDVAATRAGRESFHPERIDACLPKLREVLGKCTFTFDLLEKYGKDLAACAVFEGDVPVGGTCERDTQCKPGTASDLPSCDEKTKKCKLISFLKEGDPCQLGEDLSTLCEAGLYCDVTFRATAPFKGFCKKATSLGVACDKTKNPVQLECGLGNYCDLDTAKCTVGRAGGVACKGLNFECASLACTAADAGVDAASPPGTCVPLSAVNKPLECKRP